MPLEIRAAVAQGKVSEPRPFRAGGGAATITAAGGAGDAKKLRSFTGRAYTGQPMTPEGWGVPVVIDLAGVRSRQNRPALRQHDHEQIVGHTNSVTTTTGPTGGIDVAGDFSGERQHTDKVTVPADNGFEWQLSVGANPITTEFLEAGEEAEVNGRTVAGPMVISRETEIGEISFVPLGADGDTSATVSASKRGGNAPMYRAMLKAAKANGNIVAQKFSDSDIDQMSEEDAKAALKKCMADDEPPAKARAADDDDDGDVDAEGDDDVDADDEPPAKAKASKGSKAKASGKKTSIRAQIREGIAAARKATADEVIRVDRIRNLVMQAGQTHIEVGGKKVNLEAHAIAEGWSAERAELELLRASRPGASVGGPLVYVTNQPEMNEAVLECAILQANRHTYLLEDDSFYSDATPDNKGTVRRVPLHLQQQTQNEIRARYPERVQQAAHTHFKGRIGLQQVFHLGLANGRTRTFDLKSEQGIRSMCRHWDFAEQQAIQAEGASNLSIANILANVMNKFALQGYLFVEQAWRLIAAIRSVNDFKATKSINLLGDVMYKQLGPTGELQNASFGDQAFANQVSPTGRITTLPWTHLVNDDLSILQAVPMKIGQGAGLALNDTFWTVVKNMVAGAVNADDGAPFFNATGAGSKFHTTTPPAGQVAGLANKMSGGTSALSADALKTAKAMFDNQLDPNGNPLGFDGVKPVILFGPSNWQAASALLMAAAIVYGGASAALQPNVNVWQGMLTPCLSRYVENAKYLNSATGWGIFFNPIALAAIEVAFLNGVDTPAVLQAGPDYQFDKLGISIRGTMPFGVTQQNYRAAVWSLGA